MNAAAVLPASRFPQLLRMRGAACGRRIALACAALLLLVGSIRMYAGEVRIRTELDTARRETLSLKVRQEVLRERIFDLARRLDALERGGSAGLTRPGSPRSTPGAGR